MRRRERESKREEEEERGVRKLERKRKRVINLGKGREIKGGRKREIK